MQEYSKTFLPLHLPTDYNSLCLLQGVVQISKPFVRARHPKLNRPLYIGVVQTSLSLARQGSLVNGDTGVSTWLSARSVIIAMTASKRQFVATCATITLFYRLCTCVCMSIKSHVIYIIYFHHNI